MRIDPRLICVIPGPPKRLWITKPPTNAPAIPIKIVIMIPPGSGPGMTHLASTPATSPITINATMPMRFHLPLLSLLLLPPDGTRKRNITDAVLHATTARFTPHPPRINPQESRPRNIGHTKSTAPCQHASACGLRLSARSGFASACQHASGYRPRLSARRLRLRLGRLVRKSSWGAALSVVPYCLRQRFVSHRRARPERKS